MELQLITPKRKRGSEPFTYNKENQKATLLDFWKWSNSDLIGNTSRGVLAEFIVAMALGTYKGVREGWTAYDLRSKEGIKIEVKSASYVQSWHQKDFSKIVFSIRPSRAWDPKTNKVDKEQKLHADVYVFALLKHLDKATINPLDLNQWTFYVITTKKLPSAKSVTLTKLKTLTPKNCSYKRLRRYILSEAGNY
jgi:hypothetical protein